MTNEEKIGTLETIAYENGWSFYREYSGRFMYGKTCAGIVTDDPTGCIEDAAAEGITGARQDSMGRSAIVYWPSVKTTTKEQKCPV